MLKGFHSKLVNFNLHRFNCIIRMNRNKCNVAVCQFTATNNRNQNLQTVKRLVKEAAGRDAKVVFLPEACDFIGSSKEETKALAEHSTELLSEYKSLAKECKIWLSVGGFHELIYDKEHNEHKMSNTHIIIDENGEVKTMYRKLHLFDVTIPEKNVFLKESDNTMQGTQLTPPVNTPAGPLALSICYDVRFPELSTLQRKQGASILTYPSAFTFATGLLHWEVLLRARAIESQCYVIAAAQYGKHNEKRVSFGQSMIVDPWGKIVAQCPKYTEGVDTNESIAIAVIDPEVVEKVRLEMPVFQHRRDDIYRLDLIRNPAFPINDAENFYFSDKIVPGSTVFYKTQYSYAFTNIRCVVPGHILVSPLRCCKRLENLELVEVADLFQTAVEVQKVLEKIHTTDSSTVVVQDGKYAGQTVSHVHVHILPRKPNDFAHNDDIYDALARHDHESNPQPFRSVDERMVEAAQLRKHLY